MAQAEYDKLGGGLAYDDYLAVVGAYQACLRNLEIVDTLITKADEHHERERRHTDSTDAHSKSISYGSYLWR